MQFGKFSISILLSSLFLSASFFCCSPSSSFEITAQKSSQKKVVTPDYWPVYDTDRQSFKMHDASLKTALINAIDTKELVWLPGVAQELKPYRIEELPMLAPKLKQKYPDLITLRAVSLDSVQQEVMHVVLFDKGLYMAHIESSEIVVYQALESVDGLSELVRQTQNPASSLGCGNGNQDYHEFLNTQALVPSRNDLGAYSLVPPKANDPVRLKMYRLALSVASDVSIFFGSDKRTTLNAVVNYVSIINLVYQRDAGVLFQLIGDEDKIIFTDSKTDPFDGIGSLATTYWATNQYVLDTKILSSSDYDVGHVLTNNLLYKVTGMGYPGGVCSLVLKSYGVSNTHLHSANVMITAHELGHQLGADHTYSSKKGGCGSLAQYNEDTAVEPGAGSSLMAYAGLCGDDNLYNYAGLISDGPSSSYMHFVSYQQIRSTAESSSCATDVLKTTHIPSVRVKSGSDWHIPFNTAFRLEAEASSIDGSALLYSWNPTNHGVSALDHTDNGVNPINRVFPNTSLPHRFFPSLSRLSVGVLDFYDPATGAYSQYGGQRHVVAATRDGKEHTFMVMVKNGDGGINYAEAKVTTHMGAGPFRVTSPVISVDWPVGGPRVPSPYPLSVKWDVANTDKAPILATHVTISFISVPDGGIYTRFEDADLTQLDAYHEIVLARGVPNTGRYDVAVTPELAAYADKKIVYGNIMVKADNHIFLALSKPLSVYADVAISHDPVPDFVLEAGSGQTVSAKLRSFVVAAKDIKVIPVGAVPPDFMFVNLISWVAEPYVSIGALPSCRTVPGMYEYQYKLKGSYGYLSSYETPVLSVKAKVIPNKAPIPAVYPADVYVFEGMATASITPLKEADDASFVTAKWAEMQGQKTLADGRVITTYHIVQVQHNAVGKESLVLDVSDLDPDANYQITVYYKDGCGLVSQTQLQLHTVPVFTLH